MRIGSGLLNAAVRARKEGLTPDTLYEIVEQATEEGALRMLNRLGLSDESAGSDITELRSLLEAWRETKKTARHTMVSWIIRLLISALALGLAVKMKFIQLGQGFGQ